MSEQAAVYTVSPEPQSSVELSQTARGATQVTVKVYAASAEDAAQQAQALYDALVAKYRQVQP